MIAEGFRQDLRFAARLLFKDKSFCLIATAALALALYGVTALSVNQRTQEFGVHFALGATPGQVMRQVLREGSRQFLTGGSIGLILTIILGRLGYAFITDFLYQVNPFDWFAYVAVAVLCRRGNGNRLPRPRPLGHEGQPDRSPPRGVAIETTRIK